MKEADTEGLEKLTREFLSREEIILRKKTKTSEKDTDIRPLITDGHAKETASGIAETPEFSRRRSLRFTLAQGSSQNLKPSAVMEALCAFGGCEYDPFGYRVVRLNLYDGEMKALEELGDPF